MIDPADIAIGTRVVVVDAKRRDDLTLVGRRSRVMIDHRSLRAPKCVTIDGERYPIVGDRALIVEPLTGTPTRPAP